MFDFHRDQRSNSDADAGPRLAKVIRKPITKWVSSLNKKAMTAKSRAKAMAKAPLMATTSLYSLKNWTLGSLVYLTWTLPQPRGHPISVALKNLTVHAESSER